MQPPHVVGGLGDQWTPCGSINFAAAKRISRLAVGIDFSHTDPDFLDRLIGIRRARYVSGLGAVFHPKIYYFEVANLRTLLSGAPTSREAEPAQTTRRLRGGRILAPTDDDFRSIRMRLGHVLRREGAVGLKRQGSQR